MCQESQTLDPSLRFGKHFEVKKTGVTYLDIWLDFFLFICPDGILSDTNYMHVLSLLYVFKKYFSNYFSIAFTFFFLSSFLKPTGFYNSSISSSTTDGAVIPGLSDSYFVFTFILFLTFLPSSFYFIIIYSCYSLSS